MSMMRHKLQPAGPSSLVAILVAGFCLVFLCAALISSYPISSDEVVYLRLARKLASAINPHVQSSLTFANFDNIEKSLPNPVFSMIISPLMLVGQWKATFLLIKLGNSLFVTLTGLCIYFCARQLRLSAGIALSAVAAWFVFPYTNHAGFALTEPLYYLSFSAFVLFFISDRSATAMRLCLAGVFVFFLLKIKILFLLLVPAVGICIVLDHKSARERLTGLICFIAPLLALIILQALTSLPTIGGYESDLRTYPTAFGRPADAAAHGMLALGMMFLLLGFMPIALLSRRGSVIERLRTGPISQRRMFVICATMTAGSLGLLSLHTIGVDHWSLGTRASLVHERLYAYLAPFWLVWICSQLTAHGAFRSKDLLIAGGLLVVCIGAIAYFNVVPEGYDVIPAATLSLRRLAQPLVFGIWGLLVVGTALSFTYLDVGARAWIIMVAVLIWTPLKATHLYRVGFYGGSIHGPQLFYPHVNMVDDGNISSVEFDCDPCSITTTYRAVLANPFAPQLWRGHAVTKSPVLVIWDANNGACTTPKRNTPVEVNTFFGTCSQVR
jgi:hypothetical protein